MVPLLEPLVINPHATIITLFMNAVDENLTEQDRLAGITPQSPAMQRLAKYLPPKFRQRPSRWSPELIIFTFVGDLVRTYDHIFER